MDTELNESFLRRKSPAVGAFVSVLLVIVLLLPLLAVFIARSTIGLLGGSQLVQSMNTLLKDDYFRDQLSEFLEEYAPEDSLTIKDIDKFMEESEFADTIGQLSSDLLSEVLSTDARDEIDPVDAAITVLEGKQYRDALDGAMKELNFSDEDLYETAVTLSEEIGFACPPRSSDNMDIIIAVLDGSRETIRREAGDIFEIIEEVRDEYGALSALLNTLFSFSRTGFFLMLNVLIVLIAYGILLLLLRSLWKPCAFLSVPYILVGLLLACVKLVDTEMVMELLDLPSYAEVALTILQNALFTNGLIGLVIGAVLLALAITVKIEINSTPNK